MDYRSTQPRRARIALIGLAAAALSCVALPQSVSAASYPPQPPPPEQPPVPPEQPPPVDEVSPQGAASGGGAVASAGSLPATGGSDAAQILWIASGTLLAGLAITGASLRRRNAENPVT